MNQRVADCDQRVHSYFDALVARNETPGSQYIVVDSAGPVFEHAGGWADITGRVPMDTATTMMAYSMSKTITAVAVLQLVENGGIALDEPLDRYVDASPYGAGITVRRLLCHTAGIPSPMPLRWVHPANQHGVFDEHAALRAQLQLHSKLASAPGARYRYSNLGYWLLGSVVERASDRPFTAYVSEHVLRRVGASASELGYEITDTARHAAGYLEKYSFFNLVKRFFVDRDVIGTYEGAWLRIRSHYVNGPAFGGLVGNVRGFARFLHDQLRPTSVLVGPAARDLLYAQQRTADGAPIAMTLGWHIGTLDGKRFFYKEGGGGGFHAMMRLYPNAVGTVLMTNATSLKVGRCLDVADRAFLR